MHSFNIKNHQQKCSGSMEYDAYGLVVLTRLKIHTEMFWFNEYMCK